MKTYEGTFTILWHKNAAPDIRPLTIDCEDGGALAWELERIRQEFRAKGDDPACPQYRAWHDEHVPPYRIAFNIQESR